MARWDAEQLANARMIVAVGLDMGMSRRDITIALMTAMQESGLRNLSGGDRDSAGLFQQRPSQGWGTRAQVTNPLYSTRKFFEALKGVKGRAALSLSGAAQAVQRSAFPAAYAKWEADALRLLGQSGVQGSLPYPVSKPFAGLDIDGSMGALDTAQQTPGAAGVSEDKVAPAAPGAGAATEDVSAPAQPAEVDESAIKKLMDTEFPAVGSHVSGIRGKLIQAAQQSLGTPYVWGGAAPGGFDCSGLIYYWYNRLGVKVPRVSEDQAQIGNRVDIDQLAPGDFVVFGNDAHHIAIWLGNGRILEAPHTGLNVRIRKLGKNEDAWGVQLSLPGGTNEDFANTSGARARDAAASADAFATGVQAPDVTDEDIEKLAQGAGSVTSAGPITNFPGLVSDTEDMGI